MPDDATDVEVEDSCSSSTSPDGTTEGCQVQRQVVSLQWEHEETWCSEDGPISGTTRNYPDGETLSITAKDRADGSTVHTMEGQVSSDAFGSPWTILDVLPTGGPSWVPRRELDGETSGVTTPQPMAIRFMPNVTRGRKDHQAMYNRTNPGATAPVQVGVSCRFDLEAVNYLLTMYGVLNYVRGWGKERLQLGDPSLSGGFPLYGATHHWGYRDTASGHFKYWDGSAWQNTPASWTPDNSNHFGIAFYKSGSNWVCRDAPSRSWPEPLGEWPANLYTGAGNMTTTTLATWKNNIEAVWTDKFDVKRKECRSSRPECCRYKTRCVATFSEVEAYEHDVIIMVYEDVRSDSGMWSLADTRYGLAPHEFGHLLGAPDEYAGVGTTQLGVNDSDGLVNGVDPNCIMGVNLTDPKRRHYKGVCEVLALLIQDEFSKTYTFEAVAKAANLASPAGTPATADPGSGGGGSALGPVLGAIIGGIIGAVAGAIIGFVASGGNPGAAVAGAFIGAAAGALIGAGIGSLF